jgi:hypothetical protein
VLLLHIKFKLVLLGSIGLACVAASSGLHATLAQASGAREISFPVAIAWNAQPGVTKYRVQIATDEKFQDVFFDGRVGGTRYVIKELPAGYYFWRVAAADSTLGNFSTPVRIFISGGVVTPLNFPNRTRRTRTR